MTTPHRPHGLRRMTGRDPHESHRAATPLELLYDLTLVVAFGVAGEQAAHLLAEGHIRKALLAFAFSMFAVCWCWINYSWFASAYDNDDWVMRLATLVQMIGVLVLAAGLPRMFQGVEEGHLRVDVMVSGYVIMRVSMIGLWLRAGHDDKRRRRTLLAYALVMALAQIGWIALVVAPLPTIAVAVLFSSLLFLETYGVYWIETHLEATPWNAHHIAERYSLLALIALGEGIVGTMATIRALAAHQGWSGSVGVIGLAGISLTFGMWWVYYVVPHAEIIARRPSKSFGWGYGHMIVYAAIAATGAGLHVAARFVERTTHLNEVATVLCVAIPVGVYVVAIYVLFHYLAPGRDPLHYVLLSLTLAALAAGVALAAAGATLVVCLLVVTLAPWISVVGYERRGHDHVRDALQNVDE